MRDDGFFDVCLMKARGVTKGILKLSFLEIFCKGFNSYSVWHSFLVVIPCQKPHGMTARSENQFIQRADKKIRQLFFECTKASELRAFIRKVV